MEFNVATLFESVCDVIPHRLALVSGDMALTYSELDARANRFASFLRLQGLGAGDHVGMYLYNGHEFLEAMLGVFKIRAVPININYRYTDEELLYIIRDADLKCIVCQSELARAWRQSCGPELPRACRLPANISMQPTGPHRE